MQLSPRLDALVGMIKDSSSSRRDALEILVIPSTADATEAFRLRQRAYAAAGHIAPQPSETFSDASDRERTTHQILVRKSNASLGAARISLGFGARGQQGLPAARYYPEVANLARDKHKRIVEISRLAIEPDLATLPLRTSVFATLARAAMSAALAVEATDVIIATRPHSALFYERLLGCVQLGKPAPYPPGDFDIVLLWVTMAHLKRAQARSNSFFHITDGEVKDMRRALFGAAADLGWLPGGLQTGSPARRDQMPKRAAAQRR